MISYARIAFLAGIFIFGLILGWTYEHRALVAYKADVKAQADIQIAKNESIKKQQEIANKGITDAYEAKIAALRNYYKSTSVWNNASSRQMSGISAAPSATDVITAYNLLAGQCAETTAQTIALQDWIKTQLSIK